MCFDVVVSIVALSVLMNNNCFIKQITIAIIQMWMMCMMCMMWFRDFSIVWLLFKMLCAMATMLSSNHSYFIPISIYIYKYQVFSVWCIVYSVYMYMYGCIFIHYKLVLHLIHERLHKILRYDYNASGRALLSWVSIVIQ